MSAVVEYHLPRRVVIGRGAAAGLPALCRAAGWRRVFLVSDDGVAAGGLVACVAEPLATAGMLAGTSTAVPAEPPLAAVDALAATIVAAGADAVIGLGGGSVMDAVKAAALVAAHGGTAADRVGIGRVGRRGLPTVLVPTTAGTGSEATRVAILTDPVSGEKVGVVDPALLPDVALVDPALTDRLPPAVTAAAGMDALVHAIEAHGARVATPFSRGLALEAARAIGGALERVCRDPTDAAARDSLAEGAHLAGMAFSNSSCCAVHALALPLGGRFHLPHGVITGTFVGAVVRYNGPVAAAGYRRMAEAIGWGPLEPAEFAARLDALAGSIGLTTVLRSVAVPAAAIPALAAAAAANRRLMDPNPRPMPADAAAAIYREVLAVRS